MSSSFISVANHSNKKHQSGSCELSADRRPSHKVFWEMQPFLLNSVDLLGGSQHSNHHQSVAASGVMKLKDQVSSWKLKSDKMCITG